MDIKIRERNCFSDAESFPIARLPTIHVDTAPYSAENGQEAEAVVRKLRMR